MTTENLTIITEQKAPEGHDEKMIARVDQANASAAEAAGVKPETATTEERPSWLPEKFKSAEDLAKAYAELQAKMGGKSETETKPEVTAETPEVKPEEATPDAAKAALSEKGLDFNAFSQEFQENGELSADSIAKLEAAGFPKAMVDQYIDGQKAIADRYAADVKSAAGGDKGFQEMAEWAVENVSVEERKAFNAAVNSGDPAQAKLAVAGLYAKFQEARPTEPKMLGGKASAESSDVYESTAQLTEDMKNPLYKKDPAFRAKVQAKLGRSNIF